MKKYLYRSQSTESLPFSDRDLRRMILPLFFEQLLIMLVGMADTLVVSYAGEAAVSGVSLVNQFNTVFLYLFTALAAGGAVVISQYIGHKDNNLAGESASQLLMFSGLFSLAAAGVILLFCEPILLFLFGRVENDVMEACIIYLRISAYSYPALAIYSAGAALYRSMGKTDVTMYISVISNIINVIGNIYGVFVLKAGVAGVAWPSLIARAFSAIAITILCFKAKNPVRYSLADIFKWNEDLLRRILHIAVPNGVESGIFQLVKVALSSIVALFGTYQIAANGIAQSFWLLTSLCSPVMGTVAITVIGQCMGARDIAAAEFYFKKIMRWTLVLSCVWNFGTLALTPLMLKAYALETQTRQLVILLVAIHNVFNAFVFPYAGTLGNALRAAGDVNYTMIVAVASSVGGRYVLSYIFGLLLGLGVTGIAIAMCCDWAIRALLYIFRFRSGKWKMFEVI